MAKHILLLASGSAKRFGENKLLYEFRGKPLVSWTMETLKTIAGTRADCTLTVISRHEAVRQLAGELGIRAVDAPRSILGISQTIRAGIRSLGRVEAGEHLIFAVADQPHLSGRSLEKLLALADQGVLCACLSYAGRPGNPALFSAELIPELLDLEGDQGGRQVLRRHGCIFVPADSEEELRDIDRKEDL